jgi:putative chitinase
MVLKIGSKGPEVKALQEKLGIANPDGDFGPNTETKLKAWQKANGLLDDGIAGPNTLGKLGVVVEAAAPAPVPSGGPIDLAKLKGHIPDAVIAQIPVIMEKFAINTPLRLAHFLAQCGHESGGFKAVQENLNYGAKGLRGIFAKYFPTDAKALEYERKPEKIANLVYGNRMGNGPEASGEGYKFRGRGYIQLTGKDNYTAFAKSIGEDTVANPDLVSSKYPLASAAWFFSKNGLNAIADKGADDATVTAVTKRVNGGTIGLPDRIKHFKEYYHLLA